MTNEEMSVVELLSKASAKHTAMVNRLSAYKAMIGLAAKQLRENRDTYGPDDLDELAQWLEKGFDE